MRRDFAYTAANHLGVARVIRDVGSEERLAVGVAGRGGLIAADSGSPQQFEPGEIGEEDSDDRDQESVDCENLKGMESVDQKQQEEDGHGRGSLEDWDLGGADLWGGQVRGSVGCGWAQAECNRGWGSLGIGQARQ